MTFTQNKGRALLGASPATPQGLIAIVASEEHAYRVVGDVATRFWHQTSWASFAQNPYSPRGGAPLHVATTNLDGSWSTLRLRAPPMLRKYSTAFWGLSHTGLHDSAAITHCLNSPLSGWTFFHGVQGRREYTRPGWAPPSGPSGKARDGVALGLPQRVLKIYSVRPPWVTAPTLTDQFSSIADTQPPPSWAQTAHQFVHV